MIQYELLPMLQVDHVVLTPKLEPILHWVAGGWSTVFVTKAVLGITITVGSVFHF